MSLAYILQLWSQTTYVIGESQALSPCASLLGSNSQMLKGDSKGYVTFSQSPPTPGKTIHMFTYHNHLINVFCEPDMPQQMLYILIGI